jgi:hypothetical protein
VTERTHPPLGHDPVTVEPAEPADSTLARFDPMLRALVTFGLVEPDGVEALSGEDPRPGWRLIPAVQRRLESLVAPAPPADKLIYFGHRCSSCGEHGPTRMSSGAFVCENCRRAVAAEQAPGSSRGEAVGR